MVIPLVHEAPILHKVYYVLHSSRLLPRVLPHVGVEGAGVADLWSIAWTELVHLHAPLCSLTWHMLECLIAPLKAQRFSSIIIILLLDKKMEKRSSTSMMGHTSKADHQQDGWQNGVLMWWHQTNLETCFAGKFPTHSEGHETRGPACKTCVAIPSGFAAPGTPDAPLLWFPPNPSCRAEGVLGCCETYLQKKERWPSIKHVCKRQNVRYCKYFLTNQLVIQCDVLTGSSPVQFFPAVPLSGTCWTSHQALIQSPGQELYHVTWH